jgi:hypothetical protein
MNTIDRAKLAYQDGYSDGVYHYDEHEKIVNKMLEMTRLELAHYADGLRDALKDYENKA